MASVSGQPYLLWLFWPGDRYPTVAPHLVSLTSDLQTVRVVYENDWFLMTASFTAACAVPEANTSAAKATSATTAARIRVILTNFSLWTAKRASRNLAPSSVLSDPNGG